MPDRVVLSEVSPYAGDTFETIHYRSCDFCDRTACEDIRAGQLDESRWRRYYEVLGECGLVVCEVCLLAGKLEETFLVEEDDT